MATSDGWQLLYSTFFNEMLRKNYRIYINICIKHSQSLNKLYTFLPCQRNSGKSLKIRSPNPISPLNCNATYIGQTKRHLETRLNEHKKDINKIEDNHSVVSKHRLSLNHDFDWSSPEILHNEKFVRKREIAEMFFIKKYKDTINLQRDTENLNVIYDRIINIV